MSNLVGVRNKLKNRSKLAVNSARAANVDIDKPVRDGWKHRNRTNAKQRDGKISNTNSSREFANSKLANVDGIGRRNSRVPKEKNFSKTVVGRSWKSHNVELSNRKSLAAKGKYSPKGLDAFVEEKNREKTYRASKVYDHKKDPIRQVGHSRMGEEKPRLKKRNSSTRYTDEGMDVFTKKSSNHNFLSKKKTDKREDDNQLVRKKSDAKSKHWDGSLVRSSKKMLRREKGSDEELALTEEKSYRSRAIGDKSRLKKKVIDEGADGFVKKNSKFKSNIKTDQMNDGDRLVRRKFDAKDKHRAGMLVNSSKKKLNWKTGSDEESVITDDLPKKRKRVIRIDPHDISNKRLDDGISNNAAKTVEQDVELSQNGQFRAIKPSSEILSSVEDNLLGRRRLIELRRAGYNVKISAPLDNIPFSSSSERERIEESVFRNKLTFFAAAKVSSSLPPADLPEIAFAGRSNVGKSSLLNALTRQWGVVRTSDKPGLTQSINFFKLASKLCMVDLPGYGFAYAKEEVKDAWEELVKEYVSTRAGLKRVCLLIDTKWGMKPRDNELINLMEGSQTKYQIVLTKTDLVFPIDVARRAMQIQEALKEKKSVVKPVMMVSAKSGAGIRGLRTVLTKIARFTKL